MGNPLTTIPPKVRQGLYLAYALVGLVLGGFQVAGLETIGDAKVVTCLAVLAYVGTALGFTAASNMPSYTDVAEGDAAPPDERGASDLVTVAVLFVGAVLLLVLLDALGLLGR